MRRKTRTAQPVARAAGRAVVRALAAFVWPDTCIACDAPLGADRRHLCVRCSGLIQAAPGRTPLPAARGTPGPVPDSARFVFRFETPVREMVRALKYGGRRSLAPVLARLALPVGVELARDGIDVIAPVPLHRVRLRDRGFNQSELIASELADAMELPLAHLLRRPHPGGQQAGATREDRLDEVRGAFEAVSDARGLRVLLVDDVVTTGATMAAASQALSRAGANLVTCLAVAGVPGGNGSPESG